jgi:hypothetical protein
VLLSSTKRRVFDTFVTIAIAISYAAKAQGIDLLTDDNKVRGFSTPAPIMRFVRDEQ